MATRLELLNRTALASGHLKEPAYVKIVSSDGQSVHHLLELALELAALRRFAVGAGNESFDRLVGKA